MQQPLLLYLRKKDNAVFCRSTTPCRENPPIFLRVKYVARRWWQRRGKFMPTGETWQPKDGAEIGVIHSSYMIAGFKELCRRTGRKELQ